MKTIQLKTHIGADRLLRVQLPEEWANRELEVLLVLQPSAEPERATKPEDLGWSPGFFERTAGMFADDPIERPEQGEYEERAELL